MFLELVAWLRCAFKVNGRRMFPTAPDLTAVEWEQAGEYFAIRNKQRPFPHRW